MAAPSIATHRPTIGSPIPAPMDAFKPIRNMDLVIPQLAIDRLAAQIAHDPKAAAEQLLTIFYSVNGLLIEREREREARRRMWERVEILETRINGGRVGKSLEEVRESLSDLLAREPV